MKILYAVQKTGNGHLARAEELIPILQKMGDVDILASGSQSEIKLKFPVKFDLSGISLFYGKNGALSFSKILFKNNYLKFFEDIFSVPVQDYDIVINDFEPVTAWACQFRKGNLFGLSHQASLWFSNVPKPKHSNFLSRFIIKFYAPAKRFYGFHFKSYHKDIYTPVIRQKIRALSPVTGEKYVVYLPSFSDENLVKILGKFDVDWFIFSKNAKKEYQTGNCHFFPVNEGSFLKDLESCKGVLCNAGFELPAESLFLGKKLFVIPIHNQLEQYYNAEALKEMGVKMAYHLKETDIEAWLKEEKNIEVGFPDISEMILKRVLSFAKK